MPDLALALAARHHAPVGDRRSEALRDRDDPGPAIRRAIGFELERPLVTDLGRDLLDWLLIALPQSARTR
jgi:hypothetical protein